MNTETSPLKRHIKTLFRLCDSDFSYETVRQRCLDSGWTICYESEVDQVLNFIIERQISPLIVSLGSDQPLERIMFLPLFYTEGGDCITGSAASERPDLRTAYLAALRIFTNELGEPDESGMYSYANQDFQFAAWRGEKGAMILVEDEFDIQFGQEISVWCVDCPKSQPLPTLPLHQ